MAEYRILPTENPCALVDYSGNGNNATGCVGTSPTIIPLNGGVKFIGVGAISLPAALNTAQTIQVFMYNNQGNGGIVAGSGTSTTSSILLATLFAGQAAGAQVDQVLSHNTRIFAGALNNSPITVFPRAIIAGNMNIAWDMACDSLHSNGDTIYIDSADMGSTAISASANVFQFGFCSAGHQTTGNYQLGGVSSCPSYTGCGYLNSGYIYYAVFYNRGLTSAEIAANTTFMAKAMATRGVPSIPYVGSVYTSGINTGGSFAPSNTFQLAWDGDSLSCGSGCVSGVLLPVTSYLTLNSTSGNWQITNESKIGYRLDTNLLPYAPQAVDPLFQPNSLGNLVVMWGGTNDSPGVASLAQQQAYCNARHAVGWKCVTVTMVSRTGLDSNKNAYNPVIRANWSNYADGLIDMAADANLGADGANASALYFTADHVHVTDTGIINDEAFMTQRAINRLYGPHDFSSATVYASAAAAAVATTAGSEATNTVTLTMAATPANCQVGTLAVVTGVTPTGYNSTVANGAGLGGWMIRTRSATQITYFDGTAGLGAVSVQGTVSCPQQQDGDTQFEILNFTGNHTIQPCEGLTGQNMNIRNINAGAVTLVPFASETITGPGTTTLAAATTAILQSQLVSSAAGGCNWVRLQ